MVTKKIFKSFILTEFALYTALILFVIIEEILYPFNEDVSFTWVGGVSLIILFSHFISLVLLYKFKATGKKIFVTSFILLFIIILFQDEYYFFVNYTSLTPIITIVDYLLSVNGGIILSILYFTSIKKEFEL